MSSFSSAHFIARLPMRAQARGMGFARFSQMYLSNGDSSWYTQAPNRYVNDWMGGKVSLGVIEPVSGI